MFWLVREHNVSLLTERGLIRPDWCYKHFAPEERRHFLKLHLKLDLPLTKQNGESQKD
jgi:hypothetical protein